MSSKSGPKKPSGPERPPEETNTPPPIYEERGIDKKKAKIIMLILLIILTVMFLLAFAFCLASGIRFKQPRYFLLIINIILSTSVTGLLVFWFYRGALSSSMMWYVFVQCTFLFFQFITTDIFAWYEEKTQQPMKPLAWTLLTPNCSNHTIAHLCNGSNGSNSSWSDYEYYL